MLNSPLPPGPAPVAQAESGASLPASIVRRRVSLPRERLAAWSDLRAAAWIVWAGAIALVAPERRWAALTGGLLRWRNRCFGRQTPNPLEALQRIPPETPPDRCGELADQLEVARREVVAQCIRMRLPGGWSPVRRLEGFGPAAAALEGGTGVILWVAHFVHSPNIVKLAMCDAGARLYHLSRPEHGFSATVFGKRVLNPVRSAAEDRLLAGRIVHDRTRPAHSLLAALRVLRAGQALSMTAGAWEGGTLARCPLLGHALSLSVAPVWLAYRSGALLVPVFAVRDDALGGFVVHLAAPLDVRRDRPFAQTATEATAAFVRAHEPWILRHPGQWRGWRSLEVERP